MLWLWLALGSALFAGLTSILSKAGVQRMNSHLATAIRTTIVLAAAWLLVLGTGRGGFVLTITPRTFGVLALSGCATGASWICYFRALQLGNVNQVAAVDKSSTILTMLLAAVLLGEPLGAKSIAAMVLMAAGTALMLAKNPFSGEVGGRRGWFLFAALSAVFAALTAIFGKLGVQSLDSNVATAVRTIFVLICAWALVFWQGRQKEIGEIEAKSWLFLVLSGLATGLSWLCYYRALQEGNVSVVVPVDKLSIVVTVVFSRVFLRERLSSKSWIGLALLVAGTFLLL